jgi:PAS domain S-box-containing protein
LEEKFIQNSKLELKNNNSKSKERLDLCLSAGNLAWWEMDVKTGKTIFNENKVKMLGYSMKDFQNVDYTAFTDLLHPDDYEKAMKAMRDHLEGKTDVYETEYRIKTKDGIYKWYYDKGSVVEFDEENTPKTVKGIVIDISKLKNSEIFEKLSNNILNLLNKSGKQINQVKNIIFLIKDSLDFEAVGVRIKQRNHYPYYETNGFPKNFVKKASHICKNNQENNSKKQSFECMCGKILLGDIDDKLPFFTNNGSFWTNDIEELFEKNTHNIKKYFTKKNCINSGYRSVALIPIKTNSEIIGLIQINDKRQGMLSFELIRVLESIGCSIGITFLRDRALNELQINERRLRLAQKAANIGSWDWDIVTGELEWSEKIEPMFGFRPGQFKKTYEAFLECIHPNDREFVINSINECLKNKKKYAIEHRIIWPDKSIRWVFERGDVIRDKNDKPIRMLGVVQDITLRKEMEEELKKSKENLEKIVKERTKELINANKKLKEEILERKKAEEYTERAKQNLRNVIDSASELIISFDMNNRISTWNKTAEEITGYKQIEVLNRSVSKLDVFNNKDEILEKIKLVCGKKTPRFFDIILNTKEMNRVVIRMTGSEIITSNNECIGALFVGKDITKEIELHKKLLQGNSYLIINRKNTGAMDLLINLSINEFKGLIITRGNPEQIKRQIPSSKNIEISLLTKEKIRGITNISDLDELKQNIQTFSKNNKKSVILLDGIHYLLSRYSFDDFIKVLYDLNDIIVKNKAIMFVRIDASTIQDSQMALIENELLILPSQKTEDLIIEDNLFNILKYINEQNIDNAIVSVKKVMSKFSITYVTAASRLDSLENKGLIYTKKQGKIRAIFLTDKAKRLLSKRKAA